MKDKDTKRKHGKKKAKEDVENVRVKNSEDVDVVCSRSYIVPGNPLAPHNRQHWGQHVEELARAGGKYSDMWQQCSSTRLDTCTPTKSRSRAEHKTPLRIETPIGLGTRTPVLRPIPRKPSFLPEIDRKYLPLKALR